MAVKFANNVSTTLSSAINATQTSISVADASGLPTLSTGDYIYLTIDTDTASPTLEVVKVTAVDSNTLTVVRGQDGTTATSFSAGTKVELRVTAAALGDISSAADTESVSKTGDTMTGALTLDTGTNGLPTINLSHSNSGADNFRIQGGIPGTSNGGFSIRDVDAGANRFTIDSSGNAGFSGTISSGAITASADSTITTAGFTRLYINSTRTSGNIGGVDFQASGTIKAQIYGTVDGQIKLTTDGSTVAATFDASQNATFSGAITSSGNITATNQININSASYDNRQIGMDSNGFFIFNAADSRYDLKISDSGVATFGGKILASEQSVFTGNAISGTPNSNAQIVAADSGVAGIAIHSNDGGQSYIWFGDNTNNAVGRIYYSHAADKVFWRVGGTNDVHTLDSSGDATFSGEVSGTKFIADQFTSASGDVSFRRGGSSTARLLIESGNTTSGQNLIVNGTITTTKAMASSPYIHHFDVSGTNTVGGGAGIVLQTSVTAGDSSTFGGKIEAVRTASDDGSADLKFYTSKASNNSGAHQLVLTLDEGKGATFAGDITVPQGQIVSDGTSLIIDGDAGKEVEIRSARDIRLVIDDNNDDTTNEFHIYKHSVASGNELLTVDQSGDATVAGAITAKKATLTDDGSTSPILRVVADDDSPWALQLENSSATNDGMFRAYVNNNNNVYFRTQETGGYPTLYFQISNGSNHVDALYLNSSGINAAGYINGATYRVGGTEVFDSSRNLTNIGTISSGAITSTGTISLSAATNPEIRVKDTTNNAEVVLLAQDNDGWVGTKSNHVLKLGTAYAAKAILETGGNFRPVSSSVSYNLGTGTYKWNNIFSKGYVDSTSFLVSGTTVIDSSRNFFPNNIYFGGATNQSFINGGTNVQLYGDNVIKFFTYAGGWVERVEINDSGLNVSGAISATGMHTLAGVNTTDGTLRLEPNSAKGSRVSHVHYGSNGDWYIRSASTSGNIHMQDGGGTVLIGKTALDNTTAGTRINSDGSASFVKNGNLLYLNRNTADGDIVTFAKDNTAIGSFKVQAGNRLSLHGTNGSSSGAGLYYGDSVLLPTDHTGTITNNAIDLGQSNYQFKSLHLQAAVRWYNSNSQKAYIQYSHGDSDVIHYAASGVGYQFWAGGNKHVEISSGGTLHLNNYTSSNAKLRAQQTINSEWVANFINYTAAAYGVSIDTSSATTSSTYNFAAYTPSGTGFFLNNYGVASLGTTMYDSTNTGLQLMGRGIAIKNDRDGSNNNWSRIQNRAAGSASDLYFGLGSGNIRFDHGGAIITNAVSGYHNYINAGQADSDFIVRTVGNTNMLHVDGATNRVGIGFGSPAYTLELQASVSGDWVSRLYNTHNNGLGVLVRTNATAANNQVAFGVYTDSQYLISARSNGRVGIKNTAPSEVLTVGGVIAASASSYTVNATTANFGFYNGGGTPVTYAQMPASGKFELWKPNTGAFFIADSGGRIGIQKVPVSTVSLSIAAQASTSSSYGLEVTNATSNTRFLVDGTGHSYFYKTDNAVGMRWDAVNSRLGVNVGSPSYTLDVRGNARIGNGISAEQDIIFQAGSGNWQVGTNASGNGTSNNQFYIYDSAYRFTVQKGANRVGIGTNAPVGTLELNNGSSAVELQFKETSTAYHRLGIKKLGSQLQLGEYNNDGTSLTPILTLDGNGENATFANRVGINKAVNSTVALSVGADATSTTSYGLEVTDSGAQTRFLVDGVGSSFFYKSDNALGMKFNTAPTNLAPLFDITNTSNSTASSCGLSVQGGGNSGSTGYQFRTKDLSGNVDFFIRGDGNVGIGPNFTSPSALLHVQSNDSTTNATVDLLRLTTLSTGTTTTGFGPEIRFQAERNDGTMQNTGSIASVAEINSGTNISSGLAFNTGTVGVLSEKMRLNYLGYLGLGRNTAYYGLDLKAPGNNLARLLSSSGDALVRIIANNYATESDARLFLGEADTYGMTFEYDGVANIGYIGMNDNVDPTGSYSRRITFPRTNTTTSFMAGNVGIGHSNPASPLTVQADSGAGAARFIGRSSDNIASVGFYNNAQTADTYLQSNGSWIRARADSGFHFRRGGTPAATDTDGFTINGLNVGINNDNPQHKLDIWEAYNDVTMRLHRVSSGLASTDCVGIGFSQRSDTNVPTSDTRAGIFSTYNGNLFLATEPGGNLNSNPGDHSALMITGTSQNIGIGNVSPSSKLHITTSGGSTTAPNVVLTVQADTSSTITTGGGTAIKFKGVSSGGNIQNYDQAMIASLGQATNNGHGLDFYVKPNAATELTKAVTITSGKVLNAVGGYQQNGTTVIDGSSGHLASDGSASVPSYRFSSDTDTGLFRAGSGQVSVSANGVHRMTFRNYGIDMTMNSSGYVDLHRSGGITFYGDESAHHSIRSRDMAGYASADLRINSYRGIFFNLDSNNNDTSGANLIVGRHGGTSSTISGLFKVDGENGNVTAEGTITASTTVSDIRRKENVEIIPDALEKVKQLDGITFNFIGDDTPMTGLIAQQVQEVLPSAVYETELLNGEKTLALHYGNTVGLLVESIKTLEAQVSALTKTIEEMQNGSDKDK